MQRYRAYPVVQALDGWKELKLKHSTGVTRSHMPLAKYSGNSKIPFSSDLERFLIIHSSISTLHLWL
jgi:hypothetical protein